MVMSERIVHCGMSYIILVGKVGGGSGGLYSVVCTIISGDLRIRAREVLALQCFIMQFPCVFLPFVFYQYLELFKKPLILKVLRIHNVCERILILQK